MGIMKKITHSKKKGGIIEMKKVVMFVVMVMMFAVFYLLLEFVGKAVGLSHGTISTIYYLVVAFIVSTTARKLKRKEE